jgi:hypothetical protein
MAFGLRKGSWAGALAVVTAANVTAQAVPSQLGVGEREAQESLLGAVVSGYPQWGVAAKAFVALPATARVAVVQGGFAWAKAYVKSAAFRTAYETTRQQAKPVPPKAAATVDDELKRQVAEQRASLEESRKALAALPADQRKELEEILKQSEAQLEDPEFLGMMRQGIEMDRVAARETYQSDLSRWEETYPANPEILVSRRLKAFLTECGDVDFSAKLQPREHKMVFANPEYELKSGNWKTCFRAGPEAVGAAREAATAWLTQLPGR